MPELAPVTRTARSGGAAAGAGVLSCASAAAQDSEAASERTRRGMGSGMTSMVGRDVMLAPT
jgi:hypothetical protein